MRVGVPGFGGLLVHQGPGLGQVRRLQSGPPAAVPSVSSWRWVFPASAAFWSTRCGPRPAPAASQPVPQQQSPGYSLRVGCPRLRRPSGPPGPGLRQLRRLQPVPQQVPQAVHCLGVRRLRRPSGTRCGPRPAPAATVGPSACSPGCRRRRCSRLPRPSRPGPCLRQLRRLQLGLSPAASPGCRRRRCPRLRRPSRTRCGHSPGPVDPADSPQDPQPVVGVAIPCVGGLLEPGPGLRQLRRLQPVRQQESQGRPWRRCSRLRLPSGTRYDPFDYLVAAHDGQTHPASRHPRPASPYSRTHTNRLPRAGPTRSCHPPPWSPRPARSARSARQKIASAGPCQPRQPS